MMVVWMFDSNSWWPACVVLDSSTSEFRQPSLSTLKLTVFGPIESYRNCNFVSTDLSKPSIAIFNLLAVLIIIGNDLFSVEFNKTESMSKLDNLKLTVNLIFHCFIRHLTTQIKWNNLWNRIVTQNTWIIISIVLKFDIQFNTIVHKLTLWTIFTIIVLPLSLFKLNFHLDFLIHVLCSSKD